MNRRRRIARFKHQRGQAILEYILLIVMLSVTFAVVIRNSNLYIYNFWTGVASQVSRACPDCANREAVPFDDRGVNLGDVQENNN